MSIVLTYRPLSEGDLDQFTALERYAFPANYVNFVSTDVTADRLARLRGVFVGETLAAQLEILPLRVQAAFGVLEARKREALDLAERAFAGLAPFSSDFF